MVKSGHALELPRLTFWNPERSDLHVEVAPLGDVLARWSPGARGAVHRTDFHQLFVVTAGTGTTTVDFVDHACSAGTVLHVFPGRAVRFPRPSGRRGSLEVMLVLFTPTFLPRVRALDRLLGGPFGPVLWALGDERPTVLGAIGDVHAEYRRAVTEHPTAPPGPVDEPVTVELLRHLLAAVLLRLARLPGSGEGSTNGTGSMVFRRFQAELERSFSSTRTAAQYAAELGYSAKTLNRACQAATGATAKDLIDDRVMLEAKRLLAHTELPASTIGARLGFSEATNFGKFFLLNAGSTPSEFRSGEQRRTESTR